MIHKRKVLSIKRGITMRIKQKISDFWFNNIYLKSLEDLEISKFFLIRYPVFVFCGYISKKLGAWEV